MENSGVRQPALRMKMGGGGLEWEVKANGCSMHQVP